MKYLALLFLFVLNIHFANAQNNKWFKGTWYGMKSFTGARLGIKAPVRIEIDSLNGEQFSGRFIYMYPKDTIARLIKTFKGHIKGYAIRFDLSEETFLLDPRSRSFWSDCAPCSETGSFSLNDSTIVFTMATNTCGDSCNGESVFARKLIHLDTPARGEIAHFFSRDTAGIITSAKIKAVNPVKKDLTGAGQNKQPSLEHRDILENVIVGVVPKQAPGLRDSIASTPNKSDSITSFNDMNKITAVTDAYINSNQHNSGFIDTNKSDDYVTIPGTNKIAGTISMAPATTLLPLSNTVVTDSSMQKKINRETALINSYNVYTPHIEVDLFDNGTIDSDAVSVYYNGKLVVNNAMLSYKAVSFSIEASPENRHLEFILIAENEGSVPPNSALMRITAGNKQFKLFISTSLTKNAKIAIDYMGEE